MYSFERLKKVLKRKREARFRLLKREIRHMRDNIEKALSLEGVIYQVSADAFFGFRRLRFIKKLFEMGKIVIVGSDMHNMDTRKNKMAEAYKKAIKKNKGFEIMFDTDISALL